MYAISRRINRIYQQKRFIIMAKVNIKLQSKKEVASKTMTFHFCKHAGFTFKREQKWSTKFEEFV